MDWSIECNCRIKSNRRRERQEQLVNFSISHHHFSAIAQYGLYSISSTAFRIGHEWHKNVNRSAMRRERDQEIVGTVDQFTDNNWLEKWSTSNETFSVFLRLFASCLFRFCHSSFFFFIVRLKFVKMIYGNFRIMKRLINVLHLLRFYVLFLHHFMDEMLSLRFWNGKENSLSCVWLAQNKQKKTLETKIQTYLYSFRTDNYFIIAGISSST